MKKSNILIAVLVVMSAASAAKAESVKVNFDGSASGTESFTEALNADIAALIKNNKTKILYDDNGVYVINGRRLFVLGYKQAGRDDS